MNKFVKKNMKSKKDFVEDSDLYKSNYEEGKEEIEQALSNDPMSNRNWCYMTTDLDIFANWYLRVGLLKFIDGDSSGWNDVAKGLN